MSIFGFDLVPWSPEAIATLITGLAAVGAAVYVGRKQTAIGRRQTAILERQAEIQIRLAHLEKMKIRVSLFDKRFEVYVATQRMVVQILRDAAPPDNEAKQGFINAMDRSRLLFDDEVYKRLRGVWTDVCDIGLAYSRLRNSPGVSEETYQAAVESEARLMSGFAALGDDLSQLFGDKLILDEQVGIE